MRARALASALALVIMLAALALLPCSHAATTMTANVTYNGSYVTVTVYVVSSTVTYVPTNVTLTVVEGNYKTIVTSSNPYGVASAPLAWIPNATATVRVSSGNVTYNTTYVLPWSLVTRLSAYSTPGVPPYAAPLTFAVGLSAVDLYVLVQLLTEGGKKRRLTLLALIIISLVLNIAAFPATQYYVSARRVATYRVAYPTATYTTTNTTLVMSPNPWTYALYVPFAMLIVDIMLFAITYAFSEAEEAIVLMSG